MLSDLTLEMWVPNFRWMAAHRMHRKMPNCNHLLAPTREASIGLVEARLRGPAGVFRGGDPTESGRVGWGPTWTYTP